jgi:hypothetical protein
MKYDSYLNVVSRYRLSGRGLGDCFAKEYDIKQGGGLVSRDYVTQRNFEDGIDFSFAVASHSVNISYESADTLVVKAHPDDIDAVTKYIAENIECGIVSKDRLVGEKHVVDRVSFDEHGEITDADWLGRGGKSEDLESDVSDSIDHMEK